MKEIYIRRNQAPFYEQDRLKGYYSLDPTF